MLGDTWNASCGKTTKRIVRLVGQAALRSARQSPLLVLFGQTFRSSKRTCGRVLTNACANDRMSLAFLRRRRASAFKRILALAQVSLKTLPPSFPVLFLLVEQTHDLDSKNQFLLYAI